ncbi:hypothetical protein ACMU_09505 [Actibacterium mucosum KCTC 23349]|uniref:Uncharacterized protein n=1 Tax=Actibacterium mucosum KCTC 23349 TaxID=1454373 RepID=A0A037ZHT3_9RHOB|nr:hypothetical protein [Actibacterium mucosum]KAJ55990.1 hypothetical protein ACMU_09505 [Actibacterium mucosum KCTC 23349]
MIGPVTLRWVLVLTLWVALFGGGAMVGGFFLMEAEVLADEDNRFAMNKMVLMILALFVVASALPFVPGAEIGWIMLAAFGAPVVLPVYLCMVLALSLAFCMGRLVPPAMLQRVFRFLNLRRAAELVERTAGMTPHERQAVLAERAPAAIGPALLRHRYLALAVAFNIPGNSVAGGGGGLALFAGLSRLFSWPGFLACVLLAVAPIPAMVWVLGWSP